MEKTKKCFKCGQEKPLSAFYKHPQMADGHLNKCIECAKRDRREHEENNPKAVLDSRLKACAKKPTHTNAYRCVEMALKSGVLVKPTECSACGCPDTERRVEAHHHDYTKPLDVIWLCPICHDRADQAKREREGNPVTSAAKAVVMMRDGEDLCRFPTIAAAAKAVGRSPNSITQCLSGKSKTCAGLEWRYDE